MFENIRKHINLVEDISKFRIYKTDLFTDVEGITWEGKNEFKIENKLYDVVEIIDDKSDNKFVIVYAINDIQEENFVNSFNNIVDDLLTEHTSNPKIRTMLFNLISQALPKIDFSLIPANRSYIIPDHLTLILNSIQIDVLSPPPKFV
jgi:hypothetical protein